MRSQSVFYPAALALAGLAAALPLRAAETGNLRVAAGNLASAQASAQGPFSSAASSLQQYKTPQWFRDAKFGIWAH